MKPYFRSVVGALVALGTIVTPLAAREDPQSASAGAAAALTALLEQRNLEAIAVRDPDQQGRFIAALYFRGSQLLVVSAPYPVPAALDKRIAAAEYMDVYVDMQSVSNHEGQFFVVDPLADGLRRVCERDEAFDSTSRNGAAHVSFDGKWETQQLTEAEYDARFREDDARYARMLAVLAGSLAGAKAPSGEIRKGGR